MSEDKALFADAFDALIMEDSIFDTVALKLESIVFAHEDMDKAEGSVLDLYTSSQASHFERIDIIARAFANFNNSDAGQIVNSAAARNTAKYINSLEEQVRSVLKRGTIRAILLVSEIDVTRSEKNTLIKAVICNLSGEDINDVKVRISTAMRLNLGASVEQALACVPAGLEVSVSWTIDNQDVNTVEMPMFAVELEAAGVKAVTGYEGF